jgi:hypothetical protein
MVRKGYLMIRDIFEDILITPMPKRGVIIDPVPVNIPIRHADL